VAAENGHIDCLLYASKNGAHYNKKTSIYVEDKFGITLETYVNSTTKTIVDNVHKKDDLNDLVNMYKNQINQMETYMNSTTKTIVDNVHKKDDLNDLVNMYKVQINQLETALRIEQDNCLTLKKNYESLQTEFYILKDAYNKKCSNNN
jgi:hypothetical protein